LKRDSFLNKKNQSFNKQVILTSDDEILSPSINKEGLNSLMSSNPKDWANATGNTTNQIQEKEDS
jgi:hypothetical protein